MANKSVKSERRQQIIEALHKCLLEKPFSETSIRDIARVADLNHGVLHYYFNSKEEILFAYVDYILQRYISILNEFEIDTNPKSAIMNSEELVGYIYKKVPNINEYFKINFELCEIATYNKKIGEKVKAAFNEVEDELAKAFVKLGVEEVEAGTISKSYIGFFEGITLIAAVHDYGKEDIIRLINGTASWFVKYNCMTINK